MTAEGMTSVSVSLETRRQLNQMRSMMEFKNIDLLLEHLLMEKRLSRLSVESKQLQEHLEKLDGIDVNDLIEETSQAPKDIFLDVPEFEWTKLLISTNDDSFKGLTTGLDGSVYIAGETSVDERDQQNINERNAFLSKYNLVGDKQWTKLLGRSWNDDAWGIKTVLDGSI